MSGAGLEIEVGLMYLQWTTGPVGLDWGVGQPQTDWTTGPVTISLCSG